MGFKAIRRIRSGDALDSFGLSRVARAHLDEHVQARVVEAWSRGRALILNANKPSYSEAFTVQCDQYRAVRTAIFDIVDSRADVAGEVALKTIVAAVQDRLGSSPLFPHGRMTNYARYIKVDMEARGELERIPASAPQRIRRPRDPAANR